MDSTTLRFFLFLLGIALVVGIYLWDRKKHVDSKLFQRQALRRKKSHDLGVFDEPEDSRQDTEPSLKTSEDFSLARSDDFQLSIDDIAGDELSFSATQAFQEYQAGAQLPTKIIQVNLLARKADISGQMILDLMTELNMQLADFNIFHRLDKGSGKSIFSLANIVEPGTFNLDEMDTFKTPGLTLFAQLPAPVDCMTAFSELMSAAKKISYIVGAEMQDSAHCALTSQSIEHQREEIIEYRQKLRLALQSL